MSKRRPGEPRDLRHLPLREEPIGDSALIEDLDGACVQAAGARADEVLAGAPLDNGNVDARQRQLARQHQPCRTSSGDHHRMLGHRVTPVGTSDRSTSSDSGSKSPRDPCVDTNTRISVSPVPEVLAQASVLRRVPGLEASPLGAICMEWRCVGCFLALPRSDLCNWNSRAQCSLSDLAGSGDTRRSREGPDLETVEAEGGQIGGRQNADQSVRPKATIALMSTDGRTSV